MGLFGNKDVEEPERSEELEEPEQEEEDSEEEDFGLRQKIKGMTQKQLLKFLIVLYFNENVETIGQREDEYEDYQMMIDIARED